MTSLTSEPPCWVDAPREGTNSADDFVRTILWLLGAGALQQNDILFMDNAAIHFAKDIRETLMGLAAKLSFLTFPINKAETLKATRHPVIGSIIGSLIMRD